MSIPSCKALYGARRTVFIGPTRKYRNGIVRLFGLGINQLAQARLHGLSMCGSIHVKFREPVANDLEKEI